MYFTSNIVFLSHDSWVFNSSNDLQQTAGNLQFYVKDLLPRLTSTSAKVACFEVVRKVGGCQCMAGLGWEKSMKHACIPSYVFFLRVLYSLDNFL